MSNQRPRYRAPFAPTVIVDGHARTSLQYLADQPFDACMKHHYLPAITKQFNEPHPILLKFLTQDQAT